MTLHRWHRRAVATVAAAVVLPALSLLAPSAASAQELRFADPRHDVLSLSDLDTSQLVVDPTRTNGDITGAFVHFRKGRLVVRLDFARLDPSNHEVLGIGGDVRTSKHRTYTFEAMAAPGHPAGHDDLTRGVRTVCEIGHRLDYRHDFARVVIPLSCLDHPRWVRMQFGYVSVGFDRLITTPEDLDAAEFKTFVDFAAPDNRDMLSFTPRIHVPRHGWTA